MYEYMALRVIYICNMQNIAANYDNAVKHEGPVVIKRKDHSC
jgi:hypothetical protein